MHETEDLERHLKEKGYKLTKNRRLLLHTLLQNPGKWMSAQEIHEAVAVNSPSINFSTIYRNLDTLSDIDLLCRIPQNDGIQYYTINNHRDHHHHLICKSCGRVVALDYCPLNGLNGKDLSYFSELECRFEVYGYCPVCQAIMHENAQK